MQFFGWFESDGHIYVAMEHIEYGDLASLTSVDKSAAKVITKQLLWDLKTMHENNFCYHDLKPMVRISLGFKLTSAR